MTSASLRAPLIEALTTTPREPLGTLAEPLGAFIEPLGTLVDIAAALFIAEGFAVEEKLAASPLNPQEDTLARAAVAFLAVALLYLHTASLSKVAAPFFSRPDFEDDLDAFVLLQGDPEVSRCWDFYAGAPKKTRALAFKELSVRLLRYL